LVFRKVVMKRLSDIQILKLGKTLHHIKNSNFFYGQRFPDKKISTYSELAKLPLMSFESLAQGYPFAFSCCDTADIVKCHQSFAGSSQPVMNILNDFDMEHTAEVSSRAYSIAGINGEDSILMISPAEKYPGFLYTSERLKHFVITASDISPKNILNLINDTESTCLFGDTADLSALIEEAKSQSINLHESPLSKGVFCGKPLTEGTRKHFEKEYGIEAFSITDFSGLLFGMGAECRNHEGIHIWDDHYLAEIINSETGQPLPDGETGELAVTTLTHTALPLIRFCTGKKASVVSREKCECGLTSLKISYFY